MKKERVETKLLKNITLTSLKNHNRNYAHKHLQILKKTNLVDMLKWNYLISNNDAKL